MVCDRGRTLGGSRSRDSTPPPGARLTVLAGIATWAGPALFVALAAAVLVGDATAPLFALLAVLAPLLVLLGGRDRLGASESSTTTALVGYLAIGAVLGADVLVVTEAAVAAGAPTGHTLALATAAACASVFLRRAWRVWSFAFILGVGGLAAMVAAMGTAMAVTPWTAWAQLASRPVIAFSPGTAWVDEGRTVLRSTTLTFTETHRVMAVNAGVFRVAEHEARGVTVREWRLSAGDSLTLHAGDRLTLAPGVRVRFEAGKRIPGAALSGVAWAEPRLPWWRALIEALGLAVTLLGGAATVMGASAPATRLTAVAAPALLVAFALLASSWGVYAAWFATDLRLGATPLVPLVQTPLVSLRADAFGWAASTAGLGLLALLVATTAGLKSRVESLTHRWGSGRGGPAPRFLGDILWVGLVAACVLLHSQEVAPATLLRLGLGLGASAWAAPRLAGGRRGAVAGSVVGAVVFVALSIATALALPAAVSLGPYPALVAAPLAAGVAAVTRRSRAAGARRPSSARLGCSGPGTLTQ